MVCAVIVDIHHFHIYITICKTLLIGMKEKDCLPNFYYFFPIELRLHVENLSGIKLYKIRIMNKVRCITRIIWVSCFPLRGTTCPVQREVVILFAPPRRDLPSASSLRSVRRGVYPAKRGSSTFAPALKTNLKWFLHPDTHIRSSSVGKARPHPKRLAPGLLR